jgi:hypothetical protein
MTKDPPSNELGAAGMKMERRIAAAADAGVEGGRKGKADAADAADVAVVGRVEGRMDEEAFVTIEHGDGRRKRMRMRVEGEVEDEDSMTMMVAWGSASERRRSQRRFGFVQTRGPDKEGQKRMSIR